MVSRCSRETTAKKCTKKGDARAELQLFCAFVPFSFSFSTPSSLHKLPKRRAGRAPLIF